MFLNRPLGQARDLGAGRAEQPSCVLIGAEQLLRQCGETVLRRGWSIVAVVTGSAVLRDWAAGLGIAVFDDADALGAAPDLAPVDYLFSVTNLSVLPDDVLARARKAAINFHDGPLPGYAGLNVPAWAILNGETQHGVTWHLMTAGVDRGDIVAERAIQIDPRETALTLNAKCFAAGMESFEELVAAIVEQRLCPVAQPEGRRRYYGRRSRPRAAGLIDWQQDAEAIDRQVRALHFGPHLNPLATARARLNGHAVIVQRTSLSDTRSTLPPGTIVALDADGMTVATRTHDLIVHELAALNGLPLSLGAAAAQFGLAVGVHFQPLDPKHAAWADATNAEVAAHEDFWRARLAEAVPVDLPQVRRGSAPAADHHWYDAVLPGAATGVPAHHLVAAAIGLFARLMDRDVVSVGYSNPILRAQVHDATGCFAAHVPLHLAMSPQSAVSDLNEMVAAAVRALHRHIGFCGDLCARTPALRGTSGVLPVAVVVVDDLDELAPPEGCDVMLALRADHALCRWWYAPGTIAADAVASLHRRFALLLSDALDDPARPLAALTILDRDERERIVETWNATAAPWRDDSCVHDLIAEQVARTPDATAIVAAGQSLTYRELDDRAERLARHLTAGGVGPDVLVGLFAERSLHLPVAMLAIHKAGGAYVPLDPDYPADRIAYMIEDARMPAILTTRHACDRLPHSAATVILIEEASLQDLREPRDSVAPRAAPHHLAYVIYTSGSTGKPKGVMVEHRNVVNFFAGMDARVAAPGVWLAVTSLSFDISVLELCWTLTRGFTVVLPTRDLAEALAPPAPVQRGTDFSLFYFSSDADQAGPDTYRLLLEGARFADTHGFAAVWTPERHFHAFGGLYPNPSVTSAAVAAITRRVQIRAGSVVLPLHHPARVAEEWSVVDNLSDGRVGISFAAGWQPDDFALRPENFADAKQVMLRDIDTVRRLWRGEAVDLPGALGKPVSVRTLPRPRQRELPFWLTAAGNVETFEMAGRLGANLLTHLLGQTLDELAGKLAAYRRAWQVAGHAGSGQVTLMMHSFVGAGSETVREIVRRPLIAYLRSSASLIKDYAWSFPAFKRRPGMEQASDIDLTALAPEEFDALLEFAFERYYREAGLFGTPDQCRAIVERVQRAGVDETACLIDFGIETQLVLDHLPWLDEVRLAAQPEPATPAQETLAGLVAQYGVTHLQCTPSMAQMMIDSGAGAALFAPLRHLLIGGEAFPPALAAKLAGLTEAEISNMYGPTETTIWSASANARGADRAIPLGRPLANQAIYVLDRSGEPTPPGVPGEIVISGRGVTRGYLNRAELTADRFRENPFRPGERVYHTGDLGCLREDGTLEFLGRLDHQVKVRGHRIEIGEIEAALAGHPGVRQAIVVAREDSPGDVRLCGYIVAEPGGAPPAAVLRAGLRERLPDVMVPTHIVTLAAFPRTPNDKIDRKALPAPEDVRIEAPDEAFVPPASAFEEQIAAIWCDILKVPRVGMRDNFFDLGGHSLLAVQLHRKLRASVSAQLSITDIFRFPTIAALSGHLSGDRDGTVAEAAHAATHRALERRAALGRRRGSVAQPVNSDGG